MQDSLRLLSICATAKILGVRDEAVKQLISAGALKTVEIPGNKHKKVTFRSVQDIASETQSDHIQPANLVERVKKNMPITNSSNTTDDIINDFKARKKLWRK